MRFLPAGPFCSAAERIVQYRPHSRPITQDRWTAEAQKARQALFFSPLLRVLCASVVSKEALGKIVDHYNAQFLPA